MHMYTSSWVKRKRFHRKSEFQMNLLISGHYTCIGVRLRYTNTASPYKAL